MRKTHALTNLKRICKQTVKELFRYLDGIEVGSHLKCRNVCTFCVCVYTFVYVGTLCVCRYILCKYVHFLYVGTLLYESTCL